MPDALGNFPICFCPARWQRLWEPQHFVQLQRDLHQLLRHQALNPPAGGVYQEPPPSLSLTGGWSHPSILTTSVLFPVSCICDICICIAAVLRLKLIRHRTPKIHTRLVIPSCQAQEKLCFFVEPAVLCSIKADSQYLHYHTSRRLRPPGRKPRPLATWLHIFCRENRRRGREGSWYYGISCDMWPLVSDIKRTLWKLAAGCKQGRKKRKEKQNAPGNISERGTFKARSREPRR